jgi:signal transduction histidine kinase
VVVRVPREHQPPRFAWLGFLALVALAVAVAAYPLVRRLTRRLERLQSSVDALGAGDLSARVRVHGRDEVARLAESFNRAAARIESLVGSHRMLLANASHELRTPLARIRMGVELLKRGAEPARKSQLERDIGELDQLIDEILFASRLDTLPGLETHEEVDLLALAAEECARYDHCSLEGKPLTLRGDPTLLRRLIRNVLENARRHAPGSPVEASVSQNDSGQAELRVRDHGPGIAPGERDRVFEPFYRSWQRPASSGTGLGLALVREIARRHGGEAICLAPPQGSGALIVVSLPLAC